MIAYRFVNLTNHPKHGVVVPVAGEVRPALFLTPEEAKPHETTRLTIAKIQTAVAEYYGISLGHMRSRSRDRNHVYPRFVAMLLARELTSSSLPDIAHRFGKKDHSTVIHGIRNAQKRIADDDVAHHEYVTLRKKLAA
jgi:chromosomal replication initiation ATPase DnaA